ncbi:MAG: P1 family peptidase [Clostridiales bacterium]|nr:P1 family peptidase [Clostridiales bacterium]
MRIGDFGIKVGGLPAGPLNKISDVPGVTVGHCTVVSQTHNTGVTVVLPGPGNPFAEKRTAAAFVLNGFGKTAGLVQIDELGTLETPIALTNTLNVGKVHDALVSYMLDVCAEDGVTLTTVNPVVCECNDSGINDIALRPVDEAAVRAAINGAGEEFALGAVGAGRGTVCYGMKGGIGSSSRLIELDGETFTVGVLVQSNYGASADFRAACLPEGLAECDRGSIIMIVATDLPLTCRQLKRVLRRCSVGMARLGSYIGHGSGEVAVGFTTAPREKKGHFEALRALREEDMNLPFRAVGEATEEAILQSMLACGPDRTLEGKPVPSLRQFLQETGA